MTPETVVEILRHALFLTILLVTVIIVPGLIVGLLVAIFQAATSINEQTLSFLPRLLVTLITIMFLGHWIINQLLVYTDELFRQIPLMLT